MRPPDPPPHCRDAFGKRCDPLATGTASRTEPRNDAPPGTLSRIGRSRSHASLLAALLTALLLTGAYSALGRFRHFRWNRELRSAMEYVLRNAQPGDAVACVSDALQPAATAYLQERDLPVLPRALASALALPSAPDELSSDEEASALQNLASLWVLAVDQPETQRTNAQVHAKLDGFMRLTDERSFDHIHLTHYLPRRPPSAPDSLAEGITVADAAAAWTTHPPQSGTE